jgi:hypothetical protein
MARFACWDGSGTSSEFPKIARRRERRMKIDDAVLEKKMESERAALRSPKSCRACIMSVPALSVAGDPSLYCRFDGNPTPRTVGPVKIWFILALPGLVKKCPS